MRSSAAGNKLHVLGLVLRSVLLISSVSLLFSCGGGNPVSSPDRSQISKAEALYGPCLELEPIAAGAYHTVALKQDGTVMAVGNNGQGQLNVAAWTHIRAITAGMYHTVGLKADGTVVAVGNNGHSQLDVGAWKDIVAIAAGAYHTVALKQDGTVVAVGNNGYGQLEVGAWKDIVAIAAGAYHTVGLAADGTVVAVGYNNFGQLDVSSFTGIMPVCGLARDAFLDVSAPSTTAVLSGTLGENGWYRSDLELTLIAEDGENGSSVKEIHYIIDGEETIVQGSTASLTVSGDGRHAVSWYAIDNAENKEVPQEMSINIDTTPPPFTLTVDPPILWPPNHTMRDVVVGGAAADEGSGVASEVIIVDDDYGIHNMTVPDFGSTIQLESWREGGDLDGRTYTITATVTDNAGNTSTGTVTVLVPHDMGGNDGRHGHGHGHEQRHDFRHDHRHDHATHSRDHDHREGRH